MTHLRTAFFSLILTLFLCALASAQTASPTPGSTTALRLTGTPGGVSSYKDAVTGTTTNSYATIYGAYTGAQGGCASPTTGSTCSSCTTNLNACSTSSVYPTLRLTVPLISNTAATFQNFPQVFFRVGSTTTGAQTIDNSPALAVNQGFNAEISWQKICDVANGAGVGCTQSFSTTLSIGIDNNNDGTFEEKVDFNVIFSYADGSVTSVNNTSVCPPGTAATLTNVGICYFQVVRGDEKVYISDYSSSSNAMTNAGGMKYNRMVFFYKEYVGGTATPNLGDLNPSLPNEIINLNVSGTSEPTISDNRIRGLTNGNTYCFLLGNMDEAGVITQFVDPTTLTAAKACATPAQVVGLLDDKKCFIATATFGSPMAPEVVTFRQFRNQFLLTNDPGRAFVHWYYKYGPIGAKWITEHETLKYVSLTVLWPLLLFVKLCLALGLAPAFLILLVGGAAVFRGVNHLRRSRELPT